MNPDVHVFQLPLDKDAFKQYCGSCGFEFDEVQMAKGVEDLPAPHDLDFTEAKFSYKKTTDLKLMMFHPTGDDALNLLLRKNKRTGLIEVYS